MYLTMASSQPRPSSGTWYFQDFGINYTQITQTHPLCPTYKVGPPKYSIIEQKITYPFVFTRGALPRYGLSARRNSRRMAIMRPFRMRNARLAPNLSFPHLRERDVRCAHPVPSP